MKTLQFLILALIITTSCLRAEADKKQPSEPSAKKDKKAEALAPFTAKLTPLKGTVPAQWRIIWKGDASSQATISWSTLEKGGTHTLFYSTTDQKADLAKYEHKQDCQRNGQYNLHHRKKEEGPACFFHHAIIKDLQPSTKYYFVLKSDKETSRQFYFITAPKKGTNFTIMQGGDSRSSAVIRCKINLMIAQLALADKSILAMAHGGDYTGDGVFWGGWSGWLSHHELTTGSDGRVLPIIPTKGNHDHGPNYLNIFDFPSKEPLWYTTTLGSVAWVSLDTTSSKTPEQVKWLEPELKRLRPQSTWLVTSYHSPMYPAVKTEAKKASRYAPFFPPLFDKYNVDLACECDGHCIKRTIPIRAGKADSTGVTYIGEGGFGAPQRTPKTDLWYIKGGAVGKGSHVMRLDFTDKALRIRTILLDGKIFDDHSLTVRDRSDLRLVIND